MTKAAGNPGGVGPVSIDRLGWRDVLTALSRRALWRHCWQDLRTKNVMTLASGLSFRTMFALVPTLVLAFLLLKGAGLVEQSKQQLHAFMTAVGLTQITLHADTGELPAAASLPASAPAGRVVNLAEEVETMMTGVERKLSFARLGPITLLLMAWSAITLLTTIERALNRVFERPTSRPLLTRVLLYWSALTLAPLVLAASGLVTAAALSLARRVPLLGPLAVGCEVIIDLLAGLLVLACVYKFLPHARVPFRAAVLGAAVAVPLWVLAKWGFALYVTKVVGKGSLYGTIGLLPLFLVWLNVCWYDFLLGAELAHLSANLRRLQQVKQPAVVLGPLEAVAAACAVAGHYAAGRGPIGVADLSAASGLHDAVAAQLIERLTAANILCAVATPDGEMYLPARPAETIRVWDVLTAAGAECARPGDDTHVQKAIQSVQSLTRQAMGEVTLAEVMRQKE